ncbi:MAG: glycoside hydrolase family 9 protein [Oscillospiraceae bacterium]|nr:glycoside hydrolase family 9 protein [Oscillospiraceae bacterium]
MKNKIYVNLKGYLLNGRKIARVTVPARSFSIVNAKTGFINYSGKLSSPTTDDFSGDSVCLADFSDFREEGRYYIKIGFRRSASFEIARFPYRSIRRETLDAMYISRCGYDFLKDDIPVHLKPFAHGECHTSSVIHSNRRFMVNGGWHTMGGYEKDIPQTCLILAELMYTLDIFSYGMDEVENARFTDEIRWGLDFLLKCQDDDGGVFSRWYPEEQFSPGRPEEDTDTYHLGEKTCLSTLRFISACAHGARIFANDPMFCKKLRSASHKSWLWITGCSEYRYYMSRLGDISDDGSPYSLGCDFMWSLCEMYSLTGVQDFSSLISKKHITSQFCGFSDKMTGGFAAMCYLTQEQHRECFVDAFIRRRITDHADRLCIAASHDMFGSACSVDDGFAYGTAFHILTDAQSAAYAYMLSGDRRYLCLASDCLGYIYGCNPNGKAYVTGSKRYFVHSPCHRLSTATFIDDCVPGLVVAGPNKLRTDPYSKWNIDPGTPAAMCYIDNMFSYSTNEPGLHFTAPLLFISAFFDHIL